MAMNLHYQRGELSLWWAAVAVGGFSLVCMVGLMSMRYERNYFMEAWKNFTRTDAGQVLQKTQATAADAVKGPLAGQGQIAGQQGAMRKCSIGGKVVYSNVDCEARGQVIRIQDTAGFEAPKAPPAAPSRGEGPPTLQDRMIDKAMK
jgi:hypothetical protein